MELRQLAHFVAVAEEGSFTRASERVHIVQSAMSSSIRSLERELGIQLFERTTQRVRLTDAGAVFLPEARRTLAAADAARDAIDAVRGGLRGTVRLGTMQALRIIDVPSLLARFHRDHPRVELQIRHAGGGSAQLAHQVRDGRTSRSSPRPTAASPACSSLRWRRRPSSWPVTPSIRCCHARPSTSTTSLTSSSSTSRWAGASRASDLAFAAAGVRRTVTMETDDVIELTRLVAVGLAVALLPPIHRRGRRTPDGTDPALRAHTQNRARHLVGATTRRRDSGPTRCGLRSSATGVTSISPWKP